MDYCIYPPAPSEIRKVLSIKFPSILSGVTVESRVFYLGGYGCLVKLSIRKWDNAGIQFKTPSFFPFGHSVTNFCICISFVHQIILVRIKLFVRNNLRRDLMTGSTRKGLVVHALLRQFSAGACFQVRVTVFSSLPFFTCPLKGGMPH